jgi:hypothetical protein
VRARFVLSRSYGRAATGILLIVDDPNGHAQIRLWGADLV